ncbi:MAG: prepilin-type N-terminal cleavage/methylation domain-containing protein, partial [Burkholderiales bacterium]|nr:prepilin-type N-terminal cleavage/methylation domain-containing protein [Burkholderiales bacterium]
MNPRQAGFTLIELAVAMFIIVLLLGSILVPLTTQVNQRQIADTQKTLDEIREALVGFAVTHGHLPCPAISATNGQEDRTANVCTGGKRQGFIPWETLGVSKVDAWGRIFRYSVTPAYASSASPFTLATAPDMTIRTRNAAGALTNLTNASTVPAVVLSHGRNGYGAVDNQGVAQGLPAGWPGTNPDEDTNATNATTFVSRAPQ